MIHFVIYYNYHPKIQIWLPITPIQLPPYSPNICTCCKILETIIADELTDFLMSHNLITKSQHGFLKRHSTSTNLIESLNSWTLFFLSNHKSVSVANVDFQRAFDSISHQKLIHKQTSYGVSGNLLHWIKSFLTGRTQAVRVGQSLPISNLSNNQWRTAGQCFRGLILFNCLYQRYCRLIRPLLMHSQTVCR